MPTINLRPNKLTLYKRPRSPLWQCRYKLDNGEWYRQSTGTDDQAEAEDIAFKLYYGAGEREKNNLPQNTRKFGNVARYAVTRMTEELDGGLDIEVVKSLEKASKAKFILFACEWIEDANFPSVRSENEEGTRKAIKHLYSLGHRKIGHVTGPKHNVLAQARKEAFICELKTLKLALKSQWIISGDFSLAAGCIAAQAWIALEDRPTAVFCASDQLALGFIAELSRHAYTVPDHVSVMGFDDIDFAEQYIPSLTSIRQDRFFLGETAASMLMQRIESPDEDSHEHTVILPVSLVVRESTAPLNLDKC